VHGLQAHLVSYGDAAFQANQQHLVRVAQPTILYVGTGHRAADSNGDVAHHRADTWVIPMPRCVCATMQHGYSSASYCH
jgi:hypothetical protein